MCLKRFSDIFFPFNCFGRKIKTVKVDFLNGDVTPVTLPDHYEFTILWAGEALRVCYTKIGTLDYVDLPIERVFERYYGGGTEILETPDGRYYFGNGSEVANGLLYFKCVNVTSLVVNGTTLI